MFAMTPPIRATFLTDATGMVLTWNEECESLFGLTAAQIANKSMSSLFDSSGDKKIIDSWHEFPR
jgi:PAS domain S-box-containing protein